MTSQANAERYLRAGGVPARQSVYEIPGIADEFTFRARTGRKLQDGVPEFRPALLSGLKSLRSFRNGAHA